MWKRKPPKNCTSAHKERPGVCRALILKLALLTTLLTGLVLSTLLVGIGGFAMSAWSLADKPSRAKIRLCPLWSKSRQSGRGFRLVPIADIARRSYTVIVAALIVVVGCHL